MTRPKDRKDALELKRQIRQVIIDIEKQRITARSSLLELKEKLLEKEAMSDKWIQKVVSDIKITELNIKKLRIELEEREKELEDDEEDRE